MEKMIRKSEQMISTDIHYKKTAKGMMITEYYGKESSVVLPDKIEGEWVTALDAYAFAKNLEVEEIWLPIELADVGRYAFYRCRNLRKLILGNRLLDMGGGALTGCHINEVEIFLEDGRKSCLKSIVEEMRYQIRVSLHGYNWSEEEKTVGAEGRTDEEARLLFPEHYEEAVENTPARILETHHHGAGGYYRQCFYDRKLDYKKYDEMFYHTVAEDAEEVAVELAMDRLRFPVELTEKNHAEYEKYLKVHVDMAAEYLVRKEDIDGLRFMESEKYWTEAALQKGLDIAAEEKKTEILGILMDTKRECFPKKRKTFEL